jgi:hypothetical protein
MLVRIEWQVVQELAFGSRAMAGVSVSAERACAPDIGAGENADV